MCDYPDPPCPTRAWCGLDYNSVDDDHIWHLEPPPAGTACTDLGQLCKYDYAIMDGDELYKAVLCTADGWLIHESLCGNGSCGSCPSALPADGAPCEVNDGNADLTYSHCTYAADEPCGPLLEWLSCDAGSFTVWASDCP